MRDKCVDCENTYNPNDDFCRRCIWDDAVIKFWDDMERTRLWRIMVKFADRLERILSRIKK